jgi:outer membrane murein-binding lipoprotein Lpp
MFRTITSAALLAFCAAGLAAGQSDQQRLDELTAQIQKLQARVARLEGAQNRNTAQLQARIQKDHDNHSAAELQVIEKLYQIANRSWQTPEAVDSLKKLVAAHPGTNRTGCAYLYLGQMSVGAEKERYLKTAIADYSDSWYGDGVQVGAYARFQLAFHYRQTARDSEARQLFAELRKDYPDAVDHAGKLLSAMIFE